jgi:hypothetical protein
MPNYVSNIVTLVGSDEQVMKVVDFINSDYGVFDFNKIVPMPETFSKYDTTNHPGGRGLNVGSPISWRDDSPIVTEELIEEYKQATKEQEEKYGVVGWYDWNVKFWGTKWNACGAESSGYGRFTFDTAWSAPLPVLVALSKLFPEVEIQIVYADEDSGYNTGQGTIQNGKPMMYYPEDGSDEAMELYFETHDWARDEMHKDENGAWTWNEN